MYEQVFGEIKKMYPEINTDDLSLRNPWKSCVLCSKKECPEINSSKNSCVKFSLRAASEDVAIIDEAELVLIERL